MQDSTQPDERETHVQMGHDRVDWALFLDIDCTLLDLAPTPADVVVPPTLQPLLDALTRKLNGAVALISGRSLCDIDRLFPGERDAAGSHGAEWRFNGVTSTLADRWPDELAAAVEAEARQLPGVLVERKYCSLALHFRGAPACEPAVRSLAKRAIGDSGLPLGLLEGKAVIEIVPAGIGKGVSIERFMQCPPYAGRTPVFVGDDVTDENGFVVVNKMGGFSIHVGTNPETEARFRFLAPASLRYWLSNLNRSLGGEPVHEHS
jgi:trehalose 6-phosphate phosphatase